MTYEKIKNTIENLTKIVMKPIYFEGLKITVCDILRAKHPKNWTCPAHSHPWFEFNYVAKGGLYTTVDGTEFFAEKGSSYIIAPEVIHSHRHAKTGDDGFCIRFVIEPTDKDAEEVVKALYVPFKKTFTSFADTMQLCNNVLGIKSEFASLVMLLYDIVYTEKATVKTDNYSLSHLVGLYIENRYTEKFSVQDMAKALNISYRTLARKFKEETGKNVSAELLKKRLSVAKELLVKSSFPLYEIAAKCGFQNEYYFSSAFKKAEGITPSGYRKSFEKKF